MKIISTKYGLFKILLIYAGLNLFYWITTLTIFIAFYFIDKSYFLWAVHFYLGMLLGHFAIHIIKDFRSWKEYVKVEKDLVNKLNQFNKFT